MPDYKHEEIVASKVVEGNKIWFPNSRHPQKVISTSVNDGVNTGTVTLHAEEAQWMVALDWPVKRQVEESTDDGS